MKKVFINALSAGNRSGTGRYGAELSLALSRLDGDMTFQCALEADHPAREELEASGRFEVFPMAPMTPSRRVLWELTKLSGLVRAKGADLFHGPAFTLPPGLTCPAVVTVHDFTFLRHGWTIPLWKRFYYGRHFRWSIRKAALVAVDSEATRSEGIELMNLAENKMRVIPLGVSPLFQAAADDGGAAFAELQKLYNLRRPYLLTYGSIEPRKNLARLIKAYHRLPAPLRAECPLVIAGRYGWMSDDLALLIANLGLQKEVTFTGYVDDALLPALVANARVFACLSLYEGFGLPALEAMAAGTTVLASDRSSFPEVVGDSGMLVDPLDEEAISAALQRLTEDEDLRATLSAKGKDRAKAFTWESTARRTAALYEEVLNK